MKKEGETHVHLSEVSRFKNYMYILSHSLPERSDLFPPIIQIPILELYTTLPMVKFRAGPPVIQLKKLIMSASRESLKYYDCYDSCAVHWSRDKEDQHKIVMN